MKLKLLTLALLCSMSSMACTQEAMPQTGVKYYVNQGGRGWYTKAYKWTSSGTCIEFIEMDLPLLFGDIKRNGGKIIVCGTFNINEKEDK